VSGRTASAWEEGVSVQIWVLPPIRDASNYYRRILSKVKNPAKQFYEGSKASTRL
jgi:hypothetical protein